jgi:hypothetical protein
LTGSKICAEYFNGPLEGEKKKKKKRKKKEK